MTELATVLTDIHLIHDAQPTPCESVASNSSSCQSKRSVRFSGEVNQRIYFYEEAKHPALALGKVRTQNWKYVQLMRGSRLCLVWTVVNAGSFLQDLIPSGKCQLSGQVRHVARFFGVKREICMLWKFFSALSCMHGCIFARLQARTRACMHPILGIIAPEVTPNTLIHAYSHVFASLHESLLTTKRKPSRYVLKHTHRTHQKTGSSSVGPTLSIE